MQKHIVLVAAVALLSTVTFPLGADDKPLLIELAPRDGAFPSGVSASGAVVSGGFEGGGGFYWMPTTGAIATGGVAAEGISADGLTIAGSALDSRLFIQAATWLRGTEWKMLGSFAGAEPCQRTISNAYDVSRDGKVVVGFAWNTCASGHAFRWQESTGMVDLGSTAADKSSLAAGVSGDGNVVVGYQESSEAASAGFRQGAKWVNGRLELMTGPEGVVGTAQAANKDGTIIVGRQCRPVTSDTNQAAWVWRAQGGTTCLPAPRRRLSPGPPILVEASATSDDGDVIGGSHNVGGSPDSDAVIWIGGQAAYLDEFLQANGLPDAFGTWVNTGTITGISPDGRILVGWGAARGGFRGYLVILGSRRVIP
jgi:probable HAF family extracellular repeat protein